MIVANFLTRDCRAKNLQYTTSKQKFQIAVEFLDHARHDAVDDLKTDRCNSHPKQQVTGAKILVLLTTMYPANGEGSLAESLVYFFGSTMQYSNARQTQ